DLHPSDWTSRAKRPRPTKVCLAVAGPLSDPMNAALVNPPIKPKLRGLLHAAGAVVAVPAVALLLTESASGAIRSAVAVYGVSLIFLLAASGTYHTPQWSDRKRALLRRIDHAAILLLIAGTYTPICVVGLNPEISETILWVV